LALILAAPLGAATAQETTPAPAVTAVPAAKAEAPATTDTTGTISATAPATQPTPETPAANAATAAPAAAPEQPAVAATPAAAPDPLAALDPADRAIAEKVRDLLAARTDRIFASRKERAAIETFYQNRNLTPLWFDKGGESARAKVVIARLKAADADGLDAADYKTPNLASLSGAEAQAEAELKFTQVVLTYARHVQAGRFPYTRVSANNIELPQAPP